MQRYLGWIVRISLFLVVMAIVWWGLIPALKTAKDDASVAKSTAKESKDAADKAKSSADSAESAAKTASNKAGETKAALDEFKLSASSSIAGLTRDLGEINKGIEQIRKDLAKPIVLPPAPKPVKKPVPVVTTAVLLTELMDKDVATDGTAMKAARRLMLRNTAIPELVQAYASGNPEAKKRVAYVLRYMGEPARLWLNGVLTNPDGYTPSILKAVEDLRGTFPAK